MAVSVKVFMQGAVNDQFAAGIETCVRTRPSGIPSGMTTMSAKMLAVALPFKVVSHNINTLLETGQ
jgi:hypothetical protein